MEEYRKTEEKNRMHQPEARSTFVVLLLSIVTCGIYLIYWYSELYDDMTELTGQTPTGNPFILDFLLSVLTVGIWGIYVDYRISQQLVDLQKERGMQPSDTTVPVLLLDVAAYVTCLFTYFISSAIQQEVFNKILAASGSHAPSREANRPPDRQDSSLDRPSPPSYSPPRDGMTPGRPDETPYD